MQKHSWAEIDGLIISAVGVYVRRSLLADRPMRRRYFAQILNQKGPK